MLIIPLKTLLGWTPCWACDPDPLCPHQAGGGDCTCYNEQTLLKNARVFLSDNPIALAEIESGALTSSGIQSLKPARTRERLSTEDILWLRTMIRSYGCVHPADQYNVTLLLPIGTYTAEPLNPELDL